MLKLLLRYTLFVFLLAVQSFGEAATEASNGLKNLFQEDLINAEGETVNLDMLKDKIIGVYFSAHWCGPCRQFTPKLVEYRDNNKEKFEVVFVSSDRSKKAKQEYMKKSKMNWPSLKWGSASADALSEKYDVTGIPYLVLLNDEGKLLTKEGRLLITSKVNVDKLHSARVENEEYKCGKCDKIHVRQKLVYTNEGE